MSVDIVFAAIPFVETQQPIMAPGYLKAIVEKAGFSARAMDLNIEIINRMQGHPDTETLINFNYEESPLPHHVVPAIVEQIDYSAKRILEYNPRCIGLSLLTANSQRFTKWLTVRLKQLAPDVKIVIGGSGIKDFLASEKNNFCEKLKQLGLIDHYVMGDAENAIVEYLRGNLNYPGIDSTEWIQPTDLSIFPYPEYNDYDFDLYEDKVIPIVDSQGCVRTCEFCDVIEHWKKYTYKPANYAFEEMLHQSRKHNIYRFAMRNSLTNGNMREFRKWVELIADYNQSQPPETQFHWEGYFIVREPSQHPEPLWELIGLSNGHLLLGVESVIQRVRWDLGKKFSNEAIDYHLEMSRKYRVMVDLLMITGSPSETREDYEFTKQWFRDRLHYARNSVNAVHLSQASILPGTEWYRKSDQGLMDRGPYPVIWVNNNLAISQKERLEHWKELVKICEPFATKRSTNQQIEQRAALTVLREYL